MTKVLKLNKKIALELNPIPPYSFEKTVCQPLRVPYPTEIYENGILWTSWNFLKKPIGLKIWSVDSIDKPKLKVEIFAKKIPIGKQLEELISEIKWGLRIDEDLREFYRKFEKDPLLKAPIKNLYGMREFNFSSLFEMFIGTILNQNCPIKRAQEMNLALLKTSGKKIEFDGKELYLPPEPEKIAKST